MASLLAQTKAMMTGNSVEQVRIENIIEVVEQEQESLQAKIKEGTVGF